MATKEELDATVDDLITRLVQHKARMKETIAELREGKMHPAHAANRLAKMGRELYGEGWE